MIISKLQLKPLMAMFFATKHAINSYKQTYTIKDIGKVTKHKYNRTPVLDATDDAKRKLMKK